MMNLNQEEARRYLGYGKAQPDEKTRKDLDEIAKEMADTVEGRWTHAVLKPAEVEAERVTFQDSPVVLHGRQIAELLKDCGRVYLLACTLGAQADRFIALKGFLSPTLGMLADACASAFIESFCDQCQEEVGRELAPGEKLTFRFSPGYGDLPLADQKAVLSALQAEKRIGLCLTDSFLMTPRKSVVAILGVLPPGKGKGEPNRCGHGSCTACPLSGTCRLHEQQEDSGETPGAPDSLDRM